MKILSILAKNCSKKEISFSKFFHSVPSHMETRVSLKYFVNGCSNLVYLYFEFEFKFHSNAEIEWKIGWNSNFNQVWFDQVFWYLTFKLTSVNLENLQVKKRGCLKKFACSVVKNVLKDVHWRTSDGNVSEKT